MKRSLNLPNQLFAVIDDSTTNAAIDKGAPEVQKIMAEEIAKAMQPLLETDNQVVRLHSVQNGKSVLNNAIAPERCELVINYFC